MTLHQTDFKEALKEMSGLQQLQMMVDNKLTPPIGKTLEFTLGEIAHGRVSFHGVPNENHLNPLGAVHGGYAATLLDSALGCSVHSVIEPGETYTTVDLNIKYLRAMKPGMGKVTATGEVVHKGRRIATAEAKLIGEDGKIYATGNTTCAVLQL
ncbi:MAG: PaaI family thioesterase [Proteobacteria bacterium]|nr:PaaI family thioesterase [Pseudomonadota bacterium]